MSQGNVKFNRVPLKKGELVLDALNTHSGSDNDAFEEEFYKLNPLVVDQHIPADGVYKMPAKDEATTSTSEAGLLLWG